MEQCFLKVMLIIQCCVQILMLRYCLCFVLNHTPDINAYGYVKIGLQSKDLFSSIVINDEEFWNNYDSEVEGLNDVPQFLGNKSFTDFFKTITIEGNSMLLGGRNCIYNVSLPSLRIIEEIHWPVTSRTDMVTCRARHSNDPEYCENYIKVILKKSDKETLICGTYADSPKCRIYSYDEKGALKHKKETNGIAICPFNPYLNNTAIYVGEMLFSATSTDSSGKGPLIYNKELRTEFHDSRVLNDPNFISSFEYGEHVYIFFTETAVEYINCGKARYSRVARICKNDRGGRNVLKTSWTSFFKARLNCSVPSEYPYYFDQLQSNTPVGKGNYMPVFSIDNRTDMIYAVFNTPRNSIRGSAVCAFRISDILRAFEGSFKDQKDAQSIWLPVMKEDIPQPHPTKCLDDSKSISDLTLNFIKNHPLMDKSVQSFGGQPLLIHAGFNFQFTQIAVDWQVEAADGKFYDVLFVGTDNGRVIKTINIGENVSPVIIENFQVFTHNQAIVNLHIHRDGKSDKGKLIAISRDEVKVLDLSRCSLKKTCAKCVALQDPYCSWTSNECQQTNKGKQYVQSGVSFDCPHEEDLVLNEARIEIEIEPSVKATETPCVCPTGPMNEKDKIDPTDEKNNANEKSKEEDKGHLYKHKSSPLLLNYPPSDSESEYSKNQFLPDEAVKASTQNCAGYTSEVLIVSLIISIGLSLIVGFIVGYYFFVYRSCRQHPPHLEKKLEQRKSLNIPRMENYSPSPEKLNLNVVINPLKKNNTKLPNGGAELKVQDTPRKVKQIYL